MARVIELITPAQDVLEERVIEQLHASGRLRVVFGLGQVEPESARDVAVIEHWFADADSMNRALAASWTLPVDGQHWFERIVVRSEHVVWPRGTARPTWFEGLAVVLWTVGLSLLVARIAGLFVRPVRVSGVPELGAVVVAAVILLVDAVLQIQTIERQRWLHLSLFFAVPVVLVLFGVRLEINILSGLVGELAGLGCVLVGNLVARIKGSSFTPTR